MKQWHRKAKVPWVFFALALSQSSKWKRNILFFPDHFSLVFRGGEILLCNGFHLFYCKQSYKSIAKKESWMAKHNNKRLIYGIYCTLPLCHTNHSWLIIMCLSIRQQIIIYLSRVVVQTCKCVSKCFRQGKCVTAPFLDIW